MVNCSPVELFTIRNIHKKRPSKSARDVREKIIEEDEEKFGLDKNLILL